MTICGPTPKVTPNYIPTAKYGDLIKVYNFFGFKNQKIDFLWFLPFRIKPPKSRKNRQKYITFWKLKTIFFTLRIIGRVRIRGPAPEVTPNYTATTKYCDLIKVYNFFGFKNQKIVFYMIPTLSYYTPKISRKLAKIYNFLEIKNLCYPSNYRPGENSRPTPKSHT